jgi:hypothetical protein
MSFAGNEVRKVNVAYEIPMAMAVGDTAKDSAIAYAKPWFTRLTMCIYEGFEYVTVTGRSWAGPIRNAKFNVETAEFERYLADRCVVEGKPVSIEQRAELETAFKGMEAKLEESIKDGMADGDPVVLRNYLRNSVWLQLFDWHVKDCLIHRRIAPDGWRDKDGRIAWEFENYRPKESITVSYFLMVLPKTAERIPSFIKSVLDDRPTKQDLSDLREIYLAWWGIRPKNKAVREFVSNQCWYSPKEGVALDKLTAEQKTVISAIERYPAKPRNQVP